MKTMKRLTSVLLVLVMVLGMVSMTAGAAAAEDLDVGALLQIVDINELIANINSISAVRVVVEGETPETVSAGGVDCHQLTYGGARDWWGFTTNGEMIASDPIVVDGTEVDETRLTIQESIKRIPLNEETKTALLGLAAEYDIVVNPELLAGLDEILIPYLYVAVAEASEDGGEQGNEGEGQEPEGTTPSAPVDPPVVDLELGDIADRVTIEDLLQEIDHVTIVRVVLPDGEDADSVTVNGIIDCENLTYGETQDWWAATTDNVSAPVVVIDGEEISEDRLTVTVSEKTVGIPKLYEGQREVVELPYVRIDVAPEPETITVKFHLTDGAYWYGTSDTDPKVEETTGDAVSAPYATDFEGPADRAFLYWVDEDGNEVDTFTYDALAALAEDGVVNLYTKFEEVEIVEPEDNETITVVFYVPWGDHGDFYVDGAYEGSKYTVLVGEEQSVVFPEVDTDRGYKVVGWIVEGWKTWSLNRWADSLDEVGWYADRDNELYIYPVIEKVHTSHLRLDKKNHDAYIEGYGDTTVRPDSNITRAEIATIFYRLLTDDSREQYKTTKNSFSDVNKGDWYNTAVSTMANAGVMGGYPDGTFRPDVAITRAELAAVVSRFVEWDDYYDCYFHDVGKWHWAADEIALARYLGWIEGYGDGSYRPDAKITRAETVTLINRVLERAVEDKHDMCKDMITFSDCQPDDWFYEEIQEAANSHTYRRTYEKVPGQSFYYEEWGRLLN